MIFIFRFLKRLRFKKTIKRDESVNVVNSIVKAHKLYKSLAIKAHPDRNPQNRELAESLMAQITKNRHNYTALVKLQKEVEEKL